MLDQAFEQVYNKFKLHFYQKIFSRFEDREATLTTVESFCMEVIMALREPTIAEFSHMMNLSTPNAAYKINSLVKKGYVERIQSSTDKREYHLRPTQKYIDYYNISYSYLHQVMERAKERFSPEDLQKLEEMLVIFSDELMPEIALPKRELPQSTTRAPAGLVQSLRGRIVCCGSEHSVQQFHQRRSVGSKLRVKIIPDGVIVIERPGGAAGSGFDPGIVPAARVPELLGNCGADHRPPGVNPGPRCDAGPVQIALQRLGSIPHRAAAQRHLAVILDLPGRRVNGLPQRIERTGQRSGIVYRAGVRLKKGAVPCAGIGAQQQRRQAAFRRQKLPAEGIRRQTRRQIQPSGQAVKVVAGKQQIPPVAAAVPTPRTDKVKGFPRPHARAIPKGGFRFTASRFNHSFTSVGQGSPMAKARVA